MTRTFKGAGLIDKFITNLPFELHIPNYNYCGPSTKLDERLKRGDRGVNPLDEACKEHDIYYSNHNKVKDRHIADSLLVKRALNRVTASNSSLGERITALGIAGAINTKLALGMGLKKRKTRKLKLVKREGGALKSAINKLKSLVARKRGSGIYLSQFKRKQGAGHQKKKKNKKRRFF